MPHRLSNMAQSQSSMSHSVVFSLPSRVRWAQNTELKGKIGSSPKLVTACHRRGGGGMRHSLLSLQHFRWSAAVLATFLRHRETNLRHAGGGRTTYQGTGVELEHRLSGQISAPRSQPPLASVSRARHSPMSAHGQPLAGAADVRDAPPGPIPEKALNPRPTQRPKSRGVRDLG